MTNDHSTPEHLKAGQTKVFTAIRLDADVLASFKASGKGWQTRINTALRQFIAKHLVNRRACC